MRTAERVAKELNDAKLQEIVTAAWKELLLAECSDATGWNPWVAEKDYALEHAAKAEALVQQVLGREDVAERLTFARTLPALVDSAAPVEVTPLIAPIDQTDPTPSRTASIAWKQRSGTQVWELTVSFSAAQGSRTIGLTFPRSADRLVASMALEDETLVDLPLSDIGAPLVTAALPNGLVGLGPDLFLVLRTDSMHLAAQLPKDEPVVRFTDMTAPREAVAWKLVVVKGTKEQALAEALALNIASEQVLGEAQGCSCGGSAGSLALLPLALVALRRKKRAS